jgi:hypothetical protein
MKVKNAMGNKYSGTLGKKVTAVERKGENFLREYVIPHDPKTPAQMMQRNKFTEANDAWKALSPEEKQVYNERAKGTKMYGYQLFVSEFIRQIR